MTRVEESLMWAGIAVVAIGYTLIAVLSLGEI